MLDVIEHDGGETPRHSLDGAVRLASGDALAYFDNLKCAQRSLGVDDLRYLTALSAATREVRESRKREREH